MSDWIKQTQIVKQIASQLLLPKQTKYNEDFLVYKMSKAKHLRHKNFKAQNEFKEILNATLISNKEVKNQTCVIFLHGYGSNKLEGLTLIDVLPRDIDLCCFDFSASGKSQGSITTFGVKQFKDIRAIIKKLRSEEFSYKKFILWGRSMGAVASFLITTSNQQVDKLIQRDVIFQVLDSPFSSFESICYHQGKQSLKLPESFISIGLRILKDYFADHPKNTNPFLINLTQGSPQCATSSLFIFSETDTIIPASNALSIIDKLPKSTYFEKLIISQNHNTLRKSQTNQQIFLIIRKNYLKWLKHKKSISTSKKDLLRGTEKQKNGLCLSNVFIPQKTAKTLKKSDQKNQTEVFNDLQEMEKCCENQYSEIYPTMNKNVVDLMLKKKQTENTEATGTSYVQLLNNQKSQRKINKFKKKALFCSLVKSSALNLMNPQFSDLFKRKKSLFGHARNQQKIKDIKVKDKFQNGQYLEKL